MLLFQILPKCFRIPGRTAKASLQVRPGAQVASTRPAAGPGLRPVLSARHPVSSTRGARGAGPPSAGGAVPEPLRSHSPGAAFGPLTPPAVAGAPGKMGLTPWPERSIWKHFPFRHKMLPRKKTWRQRRAPLLIKLLVLCCGKTTCVNSVLSTPSSEHRRCRHLVLNCKSQRTSPQTRELWFRCSFTGGFPREPTGARQRPGGGRAPGAAARVPLASVWG